MKETKVAIIGGGPGGYVAAIRAAQLRASVVLIEKEKLGGVCLNHGCIPTKALAQAVKLIKLVEKSEEYGVIVNRERIDFGKMLVKKNEILESLARGLDGLMATNKIEVINGIGKLCSPHEIEVETHDGVERLRAEMIILAPGSIPELPHILDGGKQGVMTTNEILQLSELPNSLLIVGGGVVGVEFATIFAGLGIRVVLVEEEPCLLPGEDSEISISLKGILEKSGIEVFTDSTLTGIRSNSDGYRLVTLNTAAGEKSFKVDVVLAATGRRPNIDNIGIDEVGIAASEDGIIVNEKMQTNIPGIYGVGDAIGGVMLAHVAYREGMVAAENVMGGHMLMDYRAVPRCIHSIPEIAAVGMSENEARSEGYELGIGRFPLATNGMGSILGEGGFIKVVADSKQGNILGVHILASGATELIGEATLAMKLGASIKDLSDTIHAHPTLSEGLMEAALAAKGEAIHLSPRRRIVI